MFSSTSFAEESVERIVTASNGFVAGHLTVGLDSMLQTIEFPTRITDLATGLSNVDRDTLTHDDRFVLLIYEKGFKVQQI